MSASLPPFEPTSARDHGPVVVVFVTSACCFSVLFIIARLSVAAKRTLRLEADDYLIFLSLAAAVSQTVLVAESRHDGLGRHTSSLSADNLDRYFKLIYAANFLAALSMACAKASVVFLFKRLAIYGVKLSQLSALVAAIVVWFVISVFAVAFRCHLPKPWATTPSNCPDNADAYVAALVLNVVTDAILALYIVPGVWMLNMPKNLRLIVIMLFVSRLIVCGLSVVDIVWWVQVPNLPDVTWDYVPRAILENVVMHFSLITATTPRIHSFIANLQTGQSTTQLSPLALQQHGDVRSASRSGFRHLHEAAEPPSQADSVMLSTDLFSTRNTIDEKSHGSFPG